MDEVRTPDSAGTQHPAEPIEPSRRRGAALGVMLLLVTGGFLVVTRLSDSRPTRPPSTNTAPSSDADRPRSAFEFTDASVAAGFTEVHSSIPLFGDDAMTSGAAVADVFGSGRLDVYLTRIGKPNALYRNNGDGTFTDVAAQVGVEGPDPANGSSAAAFGDVDANGCPDLFVSASAQGRDALYMNDCAGRFSEEAARRGIDVSPGPTQFGAQEHGVTVADPDGDGDLDVLVLQWDQGSYPPNRKASGRDGLCEAGAVEPVTSATVNRSRLYLNDGSGRFVDASAAWGLDLRGVLAFTGQFVDLTGDGWQDLLVTGDVCTSRVYRNDSGRRFVDVTGSSGAATDENGMGSALRDLDGDGLPEWFVTSISHPLDGGACRSFGPTGCSGNRLYRNLGGGRFADVTDRYGVRDGWWGWGTAIEDFDSDGAAEIVQTNGYALAPTPNGATNDPFFDPFADDPMRFWVHDGDRTVDLAPDVGLTDTAIGHALVPFDYDGDGDLDILVARGGATPVLYRNDTATANHWLTVRLVDPGRPGNRQAIGAVVTVQAGDRRTVSHVHTDGSYESQKPADIHVGLGSARRGVRVEVRWPGSSRVQVVSDVEVDQVLVVTRDGG